MPRQRIEEGFEVFVHDGEIAVGAVHRLMPDGNIVIYVENSGDFNVPATAIQDIHSDKVVLNCGKLDWRLRKAIGHAHDAEDPNVADT